MSEQQHTPEPWSIVTFTRSIAIRKASNPKLSRAGCNIATVNDAIGAEEAVSNARRIVACVNACAGIATEELERASGYTTPIFDLLIQTTDQREKLSAEVEELKLIIATDTGTESAVANLQQQVSHMVDMVACEKSNAEYFKRQRDELLETLDHIAKANWREWDEGVRSTDAFCDWAKSRARFIVDTIKGGAK